MLLGGAIGLEREIKGKPAGLRTNILICVGAALLADISVRIGLIDGVRVGDPGRIAAQIVVGVGFIGAGVIMQSSGNVTGLTTAATIWVVAALGTAVGAGFYVEAAGTGALVTVVLAGMGRLEHRLRRARRVVSCTIRAKPQTSLDSIEATFAASGIHIIRAETYDHPEDRVFELRLAGPSSQYDVACDALLRNTSVLGIHVV